MDTDTNPYSPPSATDSAPVRPQTSPLATVAARWLGSSFAFLVVETGITFAGRVRQLRDTGLPDWGKWLPVLLVPHLVRALIYAGLAISFARGRLRFRVAALVLQAVSLVATAISFVPAIEQHRQQHPDLVAALALFLNVGAIIVLAFGRPSRKRVAFGATLVCLNIIAAVAVLIGLA